MPNEHSGPASGQSERGLECAILDFELPADGSEGNSLDSNADQGEEGGSPRHSHAERLAASDSEFLTPSGCLWTMRELSDNEL
jgi:hypothetical protein